LVRGVPITYHVTTTQSIEIELAVLTQPKAARIDGDVGLAARQWHWLLDPEDLSVDSVPIIPIEGHWIMQGEKRYTLTPGDGNNLVWRWSDALHTWLRVFVEEV
jgi:hypothetical protein